MPGAVLYVEVRMAALGGQNGIHGLRHDVCGGPG